VTGSARVHIRRGPGTEFPALATLTMGTTLEVQEMNGEWARVLTPGGQVGYVNSNFLALPGETSTAERESPPATPVAPAESPAPQESAALRGLNEQNKALGAEIRRLQDELAAIKNRPDPTLAPAPPAADNEKLQPELARLTSAVEALQRRLDSAPANEVGAPLSSSPIDGTAHVLSPTALLLGISGLVVGWLMGRAYGRRQERTRRSRVRF